MRALKYNQFLQSLTSADVKRALEEAANAVDRNSFYQQVQMRNPSRSYYVSWNEKIYSLKAVIAYAIQIRRPDFRAKNFNAKYGANRLEELGFEVIHSSQATEKNRVERQKIMASRMARPKQVQFRANLIEVYDGRCIVSGCSVLDAIDAAHIISVENSGSDDIRNGLLLRCDLHRLFDKGIMAVNPRTGKVHFLNIAKKVYTDFEGTKLKFPPLGPALSDFKSRWTEFNQA